MAGGILCPLDQIPTPAFLFPLSGMSFLFSLLLQEAYRTPHNLWGHLWYKGFGPAMTTLGFLSLSMVVGTQQILIYFWLC